MQFIPLKSASNATPLERKPRQSVEIFSSNRFLTLCLGAKTLMFLSSFINSTAHSRDGKLSA